MRNTDSWRKAAISTTQLSWIMFSSHILSHIRLFVIVYFLSRIDEKMLRACNYITMIDVLTKAFFFTGQGAIARKINRNDNCEAITQKLLRSLTLNLLFFSPLLILISFNTEKILELFSDDTETNQRVSTFFRAAAAGIPAGMFNVALKIVWGKSKFLNKNYLPAAKLIREGITLLIAYHWIHGKAPFHEEEMEATGYATAFGAWIGLSINLAYFLYKKMLTRKFLPVFEGISLWKTWLFSSLGLGAKQLIEPISLAMTTLFLSQESDSALAANEASGQWVTTMLYTTLAISKSIYLKSTVFNQTQSQKNVKRYTHAGTLVNIGINLLLCLLFGLLRNPIINVFLEAQTENYAATLKLGAQFLWVRSLGQIADTIGHCYGSSLIGCNALWSPLISRIVTLLLLFPLLAKFVLQPRLGAVGVIAARTSAMYAEALITCGLWYAYVGRRKEYVSPLEGMAREPKETEAYDSVETTPLLTFQVNTTIQ